MAAQEPLPDSQPAPTVSPFELLSVLWRRKVLVIVVFAVSFATATALSLRSPKEYSASAQLLFREPGFSQALFGSGLYQAAGGEEAQRTTQTNIDVVTSPSTAAQAQKILKTTESTGALLESVSVSPSANANIAVVKATRSTPEGAAAVANAFAQGYITYQRETDRALVAQAVELVNRSLSTATAAERPKLEEDLRQLRVLGAVQTGNGQVIAQATPDDTPVSPKPKRDMLLGGVVGLFLGCALALLADFLDKRLKTLDDIERVYGYPLIASIPHTRASRKGTFAAQLAGPAGESYRMLRESLRFLDPTGRARCFLITSAEESEGKSTVAVNLACALAAVGKRVILVEADMRRPAVATQLGVSREVPGLSDLLISDDEDVVDYLTVSDVDPNLSILPSGMTPPNSADLLAAGRMPTVLARVREAADVVIVDSPPLLPVADTRVLVRLPEIDGAIMVARAGTSRRDHARAAQRILDQSGRKVFGLVVTGVAAAPDGAYYYAEGTYGGSSHGSDRASKAQAKSSHKPSPGPNGNGRHHAVPESPVGSPSDPEKLTL
ncbi:MAG TPA: polysaccharide biosynthesis tyrosine autokinase [Solirubrobacteraceae bacterium]|nr:polysaccharide biosynthesis tyrosine autokinase [Solirubrobacteraceae bacterium]